MNIESTGKVDAVTFSNGTLTIQNSSSNNSVQIHINNLKNSLCEKNELLTPIFERRLKSLSSNKIEICIPDDINFFSTSQQLDEGIRIITAILNKNFNPELVALKHQESYHSTVTNSLNLFTIN